MVNFLPVRKIMKIVFKKCLKKRVRTSTKAITESPKKDDKETKCVTRVLCVFALLVITYCVRFLNISDTSLKEYINMKATWIEEADTTPFITEYNSVTEGNGQAINLPTCYVNVTGFGQISINKTITKYPEKYPEVSTGGYYRPKNCKSRHKVAVLVPYRMPLSNWTKSKHQFTQSKILRNRKKDLFVFLYNIHPFLIRQKLEYRIFVIEQKGTDHFNRGKLFNTGFLETKKYGQWRCVIFHDVDLLPLDDRILYSCPTWPRHMCATVAEVKNPKFRSLFGGVSSMNVAHFQQVNGYSNLYWGWGGEDNDLFWRIRAVGLPLVRNRKNIARYTSLGKSEQSPNPLRFALLKSTTRRFRREGISNLKYKVESVTLHHLHTHIIVDINPGKENTTKSILQWIKLR